ncbi:hypothetical protein [Hoylesella shahii]|uniref:hypothetical protein n=1 Tax=Hoylesella shahii TaxID=228603 RepID=UPI001E522E52|nr:hypothetical protein [Hoylesella shahii]
MVDDTKQLTPKVCYLDLDYRTDGRGFANNHANEELKPNSFKVLKNGEWTSGARWLLRITDCGRVLLS